MTFLGARPNIAIIMGLLPGTDGEVKMSKSLGNHIPLNTTPEDMYGKVMKVPDKAMDYYFRLVTGWSDKEISDTEAGLVDGRLHPRDVKMRLAREVVEIYFGESEALQAEKAFIRVYQKQDVPENLETYELQPGQTVLDVMDTAGLIPSRSQGRRLIQQNAVRLDGEILSAPNAEFPGPGILKVGKHKFVQIVD